MINSFVFSQPVKIYFGEGKIRELNNILQEYGYKRCILVCDKYFKSIAKGIASNNALVKDIFDEVEPNPQLQSVDRIINLLKKHNADVVVGMGGGSVIDAAKLSAALFYKNNKVEDYYLGNKRFPDDKIDIIAVPTTAGTGSEVTQVAVISNGVEKRAISHKSFMPSIAIIDPELTYSLPPKATMITGLDALSHALEGYWSKNNQPLTDLFAKEGTKIIIENLEKAFDDGHNKEARNLMSYGALLAGLAFAQTKTAGVHACSYPLSIYYNLPHGEACAFTLDSFIRINYNKRLQILSDYVGLGSEELADKVDYLKQKAGLARKLSDCNIDDTNYLVENALEHPLMKNNPTKLSKEQLIKLFEEKR